MLKRLAAVPGDRSILAPDTDDGDEAAYGIWQEYSLEAALEHRLHCGDVGSEAAFDVLMKEQCAYVVFVNRPYNVRIEGHVSGKGRIRHREFAQGSGELSRDEYIQFLNKTCALLAKHSRDGAIHFVCMDWRHADQLLAAGREVYSELKNIVVW